MVGFVLASTQVGVLPATGAGPVLLLADVAFGLILFELGYRINLRWLRTNPWFGVAGLAEAAAHLRRRVLRRARRSAAPP